jgi:tetratricopeptide (TPR) repeat protein
MRNVLFNTAVVILVSALVAGCGSGKRPAAEAEKVREFAADLVNRSLYAQAVREYESCLRDYDLEDNEAANLQYAIGNIYFERLRDYAEALSWYLKIKHFYPESPVVPEANKKIVACLERLDRSADARQALDETVQLNPSRVQQSRPGAVVARIGSREITLGDLNFEIDQLPPSAREQFRNQQTKLQFLREYVATELLYDTAKRAGLDNDQQVVDGAFQAKKALMVRRLMQDKVADKIHVDEGDIATFFQAHKDDYAEKDGEGKVVRQKSFDEVKQQVAQDLYRDKYQHAFQELISGMMQTEGVQFFDDQVK